MAEFNPDDYNEINFGEDDQKARLEFCHLLLNCTAISDRQRRAQVLRLLPPNIRFNINESDTPLIQALDIVETCNRYEGGLKKLLWALRQIEGETKAWSAVEEFIARFKKDGPTPEDLPRIVQTYQKALVDEFEQRYNDFERLIDLRMQRGKLMPERRVLKGLPLASATKLRQTLQPGYSPVAPGDLKPDESQPVVTVEQTLAQHSHLALLGAPGAGKSTTLRRLLKEFDPESAEQPTAKIPCLVELNRWQDPQMSLLDFLKAQAALYSPQLAERLPDLMKQGRMLLLLDALNEIPQLQREGSDPRSRQLAGLAESYPGCQAVLTCRVREFGGGPRWHDLHVLDLNREQVSQFVQVFFKELPDGTTQAQKLLGELYESENDLSWEFYWDKRSDNKRKQKLQGLTHQPFYLVRLLAYYYESEELPNNPALLLKYSVEEALEREFSRAVEAKELSEKVARQQRTELESALALLAFNMTDARRVGATDYALVAAWLFHLRPKWTYEHSKGENYQEPQASETEQARANELIEWGVRANLLVIAGEGIQFYHQLMQEYFCTRYLEMWGLEVMLDRANSSIFEGGQGDAGGAGGQGDA